MDNPETSLIGSSTRQLPVFEFSPWAKEEKAKALEAAALIGRVVNGDSKVLAVRAQMELKRIIAAIEKARKQLKEPLLDAGRKLDTLCASESLELEKEFGRVSNAVKEFDDAERRRVAEEQRLQQEELARIEREKQAELKRIADEQAAREAEAKRIQDEIDRKAREAKEAAERLAREATNKKQREAAEAARQQALKKQAAAEVERQKQETALREQQAAAAAQTASIQEKAADAAYCAAKPVEITKVAGQRTTCDWEITKINEWALLKARPDLVRKIEFDLRAIKDELRRGVKLAGVEAKETFKADVRVAPGRPLIEV